MTHGLSPHGCAAHLQAQPREGDAAMRARLSVGPLAVNGVGRQASPARRIRYNGV